MLFRPPAVNLRALVALLAAVGVVVALFVPRPVVGTGAESPTHWSPAPQELFAPLVASPTLRPRARAVDLDTTTGPRPRATHWPERDLKAPVGVTHVVAPGDTLWTIALRHSASLTAVVRWNKGLDPRRLVASQRILVPGGSAMRPAPAPAATANRPSGQTSVRPAPTAPSGSGTHGWPLAIRGTISQRFSATHPAIDIAAPTGTPVRAVAAGTVTWAGWEDNGGGYVVVIRHPDGMVSYYNHNSRVLVAAGQRIASGQQIARVGATGWATGPHLDARIQMGGRFVDPLGLF